ncbi:Autophagy protein 16 [Nakaseomyces bracarensis]|uniref:Autophagy protein 16 n=1 Tax=Nakaseomyces bracarensis TaxID=273131 RepID=A0ABR4NYW8_9SACH
MIQDKVMELSLRLIERDRYEKAHRDLFKGHTELHKSVDQFETEVLRAEVDRRGKEVEVLEERLRVTHRDMERLNDELISAHIETNVATSQLQQLRTEHDKLLERWLARVKLEVEHMNNQLQSATPPP